jgi:hypothetical protein
MSAMNGRDAERWRLCAEEYRAIGASMTVKETHRPYEAMAEQCDRIADQIITPAPRHLSANDCLAYAEQCDALARRIAAKAARERIIDIAEQWRNATCTRPERAMRTAEAKHTISLALVLFSRCAFRDVSHGRCGNGPAGCCLRRHRLAATQPFASPPVIVT